MNLQIFHLISHFLKKVFSSKKQIEIYTDGSHKGKWGAWAFVVVQNNQIIHESSGQVKKTNSHRMEFQAAIEALTYLKLGSEVIIYSDSRVLIKALTQEQMRTPVNLDQIEIIKKLILKHKVSWQWVRAHSGVIFNERCDQLCVLARNER